MSKYLLVDGNSLAYRAFFALPSDMSTASGQVTNAVFGFTSMLIYVLKDQHPDGVLVAFDRPEPTFRHDSEPEYKGNRDQAPDILRQQMGLVREVLAALGIQTCEAPGWEADDLIASATKLLMERGDEIVVVTGDRDCYQLVRDPLVKVLYNRRGVSDYALYDEAGIAERCGVPAHLYPQYAALRGDPSDNLPGVPGVGEKTAAKLITTYGGLDGIFAHLDAQTPKLRESLGANEDRVRKNFQLMVLRDDAPVDDVDFDALAVTPNADEVKRLFDFLEFRTFWDRLADALGGAGGMVPTGDEREELVAEVSTVESPAAAAELLASLPVLDVMAAWEGEPGRAPLTGLAVVTDGDAAGVAWIPAGFLQDDAVRAALVAHPALRGHNVRPLMRSLLDLGLDITSLQLDTAIAAYLIDPAEARYALPDLVETFTRFKPPSDDATAAGQLDLDGTALDDASRAGRDALAVHHLAEPIVASLRAHGMQELYDTIENPLVRVLARMEHVGIAVDTEMLRTIHERLTEEVHQLVADLRRIAEREDLNVNSPTQLREILYTQHGLSPVKRTKTGFSTDAQTLEKLRDQWPEFIDPLLRHREADKLRGTYGEGLLAEVCPDGRIHATFNQTVARTGRLSSDKPNLHNIPVRSDEGRRFRTAFIPAPGYELLVVDYNQIELRCIAHLAQDPGLIAAFKSGEDIHNATASRIFSVDPKAVTLDQRSKAKMVSYGLAYGMEAYGLGQRLNIETSEAALILDAYFAAFPNVKAYMDRTVNEARTRGYTETLFGRRRPIPELLNSNPRIRQAGERQAMNAGIQGLAADIFKVALVRIDQALEDGRYGSRVILQVHDEVLVEVADGEHDVMDTLIVDLMRGAADLDVPLEVNAAWGTTWADAKS